MARITSCRSCSHAPLSMVMDLGTTPLANALRRPEQAAEREARFPLELVLCEACGLVQILETVDPEILFGHYLYFSSFSDAMVSHAKQLVDRLVEKRALGAANLAMEIASNDGYLLQHYAAQGIPVLGVEPARNIAAHANAKGIRTDCAFFNAATAERLRSEGHLADVIHANNVLAHVADLHGVVAGFKIMLAPGGRVVSESPYLKAMLDHLEFDTIYHEHLCYYSLSALQTLFAQHALEIVDVEQIEIHGGSLRVFVAHLGEAPVSQAVVAMLHAEQSWSRNLSSYRQFADRVSALGTKLVATLAELKASGKRIAAYGASAKGATLLNYFGIGKQYLEFIVDRSTVKQGLLAPGTGLVILPPSALLEQNIDYALLLTWNFAEEIIAQQKEFSDAGGQFIVPIPDVLVR